MEYFRMSASILTVDDPPACMAVRIALTCGLCRDRGGRRHRRAGQGGRRTLDLIITDLNMPRMDGLTMIRELRKSPTNTGVPIIFLTTESEDGLRRQAKAAGATGWLVAVQRRPAGEDRPQGAGPLSRNDSVAARVKRPTCSNRWNTPARLVRAIPAIARSTRSFAGCTRSRARAPCSA
jgi:two-component system chemotaxis response regulator CheY